MNNAAKRFRAARRQFARSSPLCIVPRQPRVLDRNVRREYLRDLWQRKRPDRHIPAVTGHRTAEHEICFHPKLWPASIVASATRTRLITGRRRSVSPHSMRRSDGCVRSPNTHANLLSPSVGTPSCLSLTGRLRCLPGFIYGTDFRATFKRVCRENNREETIRRTDGASALIRRCRPFVRLFDAPPRAQSSEHGRSRTRRMKHAIIKRQKPNVAFLGGVSTPG